MARRHARSRSPYIINGPNTNGYATTNIYQPYVAPYYYQPPQPGPLPVYSQSLPLPGYPGTPYIPPYSYPPSPNPPIATFLGNRAPLPDEMEALHHTLQMKEATISFLDAQIEAAKDNVDQLAIPYLELRVRFESAQSAYLAAKENHEDLLNQRNLLEQSMQHLNALLHPLRRFSEDILTRIFAFAIAAEMEKDYDRVEHSRVRRSQTIMSITKVCSKWRGAASAKPELWTYVRLNLSRRSHVHDKLQHFLKLARGLPMDISISNLQPGFFGGSTDSEDDENSPNGTPLLDLVRRMRSLTVNCTHYRALQYLPSLGTNCLDTLEELHLRSEPLSSPASGQFSIAAYLAEAPNLQVLRLMHVHLLPPAPHEISPLVRLKKVRELIMHGPMTHGAEIFGFAQVVSMLPNVETVAYHQNDTVPFIVQDDIHLPRLRALTTNSIALDNALRTSFGANKVIAPKLRKLEVVDATNMTGGLVQFLETVDSIRELTIKGCFDPFSTVNTQMAPGMIPLAQAGAGLFGANINIVWPGPVPVPQPITLAPNNAPGTTNTTSGGPSLLECMDNIVKMEIIDMHPRFADALCEVLEFDTSTEAEDKSGPSSTTEKNAELPIDIEHPSTSTIKGKTTKRFAYFPSLRQLEFTINKNFPLSPQDFLRIFEARCWIERSHEFSTNVQEDSSIKEGLPEHLYPLTKLEVHLGPGLENDLADAIGRKMALEGEEKGNSWFSWNNPSYLNR
ncbi:hypothetical protein CPB86DRAFT_755472 [Serendipita vermifera]|nr:hypothetical protein CPB86DRAFT_755472 [Serendipita vermifera]